MRIVIHQETEYAKGWAQCLAARDANVRWVDLTARDAFHQVLGYDGVMWCYGRRPQDKLLAYSTLHAIEHGMSIPVFPDHYMRWHYDEKLSQYHLLQAAGVPMPETWVFWDRQKARDWALQTNYPKVFKLSVGVGSKNVVLVRSAEEACRLIDRMFGPGICEGQVNRHSCGAIPRNWQQFRELAHRYKFALSYLAQGQPRLPENRSRIEKGYAYFQELVDSPFEYNICVIGDQACGLRRHWPLFQTCDWKSTFDKAEIDLRCVKMAFDISTRLGFQCMAIDFLLHHGEPVVLEIGYTMGRYARRKYPGRWTRNLEWISGQMSVQEAEVETFLNKISSKILAEKANIGLGTAFVHTPNQEV